MAQYDLAPRIAPNLERHLVFPLLEFLQERQMYPDEGILKSKSNVLAEKLNLNYEEAERWIVNLIRTSKLEARIDSESGTVTMEHNTPIVYEQFIDHTKALSGCTYKLVSQVLEHAQSQTAR